jgi:hypothetical protein
MAQRYSVADIVAMRAAVRDLQPAKPDPIVVEAQLQTYMQNGTSMEELLDAVSEMKRKRNEEAGYDTAPIKRWPT